VEIKLVTVIYSGFKKLTTLILFYKLTNSKHPRTRPFEWTVHVTAMQEHHSYKVCSTRAP